MAENKETRLFRRAGEPFGLLRQMTAELDRAFEDPFWASFRLPARFVGARNTWTPGIDVFEKDNHLVTRVDLPGMKKEDVKVEVADGHLTIAGERKVETEEKKENYLRSEREFGSFYRAVPLPEGVKFEDVRATFADGVLEVSMPLPVKAEPRMRAVEITDGSKPAKAA
jgi:HSP20 family protein